MRCLPGRARCTWFAILACLSTLIFASDVYAHGSCTALRMKASGKRCQMVARCYVRAAEGREALGPCVDEQRARLDGQFHKTLLHKDCHPYGEAADVMSIIDMQTNDIASALQVDGGRCGSAKLRAAGRYCLLILRECYAPAELREMPVDQACLDEAAAELSESFVEAEAAFACSTTGDQSATRDDVDALVADVVSELTVPPP